MSRPIIRYTLVSGLCLLLHNIVMVASDQAGAALWLAVCLSYVIVVLSGYALHAVFTFETGASLVGFARYAGAMSLNMPLAYFSTWLWHELAGFSMIVAAPLATAMMLVFNYFASRWATMPSGKLSKAGKAIT